MSKTLILLTLLSLSFLNLAQASWLDWILHPFRHRNQDNQNPPQNQPQEAPPIPDYPQPEEEHGEVPPPIVIPDQTQQPEVADSEGVLPPLPPFWNPDIYPFPGAEEEEEEEPGNFWSTEDEEEEEEPGNFWPTEEEEEEEEEPGNFWPTEEEEEEEEGGSGGEGTNGEEPGEEENPGGEITYTAVYDYSGLVACIEDPTCVSFNEQCNGYGCCSGQVCYADIPCASWAAIVCFEDPLGPIMQPVSVSLTKG